MRRLLAFVALCAVSMVALSAEGQATSSASCAQAFNLPPPYDQLKIIGSTANRASPDDGCAPALPSITYKLTPSLGNTMTISACGRGVASDLTVSVYGGSCSNTHCVAEENVEFSSMCGDSRALQFDVQEPTYWVTVAVEPPNDWDDLELKVAIDNFDTNTNVIIIITPQGGAPPSVEGSSSNTLSSVLGGERDEKLAALSGGGNMVLSAGAAGGVYAYATPNNAEAEVTLQWDGLDGSEVLDSAVGLGGIDFTAGTTFALQAQADMASSFDITVCSTGSVCATATAEVPGSSSWDTYFLDFTQFEGVDFTSVSAVQFRGAASSSLDFMLDSFAVLGSVNALEGGQFSIEFNEGVVARPLPGCEAALSLFGPYNPELTLYGFVSAAPPDDQDDTLYNLLILDWFDDATAVVQVDGSSGATPASSSSLTVGEDIFWGSRLLVASVTAGGVVDGFVSYGTLTAEIAASTIGSVGVGYECGDVCTGPADFTVAGRAQGVRLFTTATSSARLDMTLNDSHGSSLTRSTTLSPSSTDVETVVDFVDTAVDFSSIVSVSFTVTVTSAQSAQDVVVTVSSLAVVGALTPPALAGQVLPCTDVDVSTELVWYKIFPWESRVTVSTCLQGTAFASGVGVYGGSCDDLSCVTYQSYTDCGNGATVVFNNGFNEDYFVVVYGRDGATGGYQLTVREDWEASEPETIELPPFSYFVDDDDDVVFYDDDFFTTFGTFHSFGSFNSFGTFSPWSWTYFGSFESFGSFGSFGSFDSWSSWESWNSYWEPPADDGPGSSCDKAVDVGMGLSDVFYNEGETYNNICGLYTHSGSSWFRFQPTSSGQVTIDTCTKNFDTVLAVVEDCSLGCVASNDDACGSGSRVTLNVSAGSSYMIFVGGYSSSAGSFRLNIE